MQKKDKLLIVIVPVALLTLGYVFFGKALFGNEHVPVAATTNFTSIDAPVTEARKKRTELYRDKYEKENADKLKRNIQSDEFFFGIEVKKDTAETETQTTTEEETSTEEVPQEASEKNGKKEKPETIIKYIERPSKPDTVVVRETAPPVQEKRVRRSGFVSGKSITNSSPSGETTTEAGDINIPVVIQEDTDVKSGSNIQLRTLVEAKLNGVTIPKNTLITGVATITQERLNIRVSTVKGVSRTIQMKLDGYDLDGNAGMPIEGGVNKEIKKDVVGSAIQEVGRVVNVPILNRVPINAGNKKINDPVIPVPKGYKLFLKPEVK